MQSPLPIVGQVECAFYTTIEPKLVVRPMGKEMWKPSWMTVIICIGVLDVIAASGHTAPVL
jgi:hypothetical protein